MSEASAPAVTAGNSQPAPGMVYGLFAQLRKEVGVLKAKKKDGVKFKVRSAEDLNDKIRAKAIDLGLLILPVDVRGKGFPVEDGTLAEVTVTLEIRAIADGSSFCIQGFGLGADNQDKAGGKAGTYAWKAALVQALLAGGADDTDDTDTAIQGGVRKKGSTAGKVTVEMVLAAAKNAEETKQASDFTATLALAKQLPVPDQFKVGDALKAAKAAVEAAKATAAQA